MSPGPRVIDRLRRPEYTGENRCVPCTATNVVIAAALAGAVWLSLPPEVGLAAGAAVFAVAAAVIYLRGYLVPGTPWFTRTYFPDWLLRAFDKGPAAPRAGAGADEAVDVESLLVDAGALTECSDVDDLCLTDEFRDAWRVELEALGSEDATHRDLAATVGDDLVFEEYDGSMVAMDGQRVVGQWGSEAALLADAAAAGLLEDRVAGWEDLDLGSRGAVLTGLRLFVERCPSCDGPVTMGEEVVQSCCRSTDVVAVSCEDCGARIVETEVPEPA